MCCVDVSVRESEKKCVGRVVVDGQVPQYLFLAVKSGASCLRLLARRVVVANEVSQAPWHDGLVVDGVIRQMCAWISCEVDRGSLCVRSIFDDCAEKW